MGGPLEVSLGEIKRLQRCVNDLVSVLALPAIWAGGEPSQVIRTLLPALQGMLDLDLACVRLNDPFGEPTLGMTWDAQSRELAAPSAEISELLDQFVRDDSKKWPDQVRSRIRNADLSIAASPLGLQGEIGVLVAGSRREDFPGQTERLVLNVAANQAAIGLQAAQLLSEQKRVAGELDRRVVQRTQELADSNEALRMQVGLLQLIPVAAWTLKPDGTPDFVNDTWLEYSGQTLEFVRSRPGAWMAAVHPEDREIASKSFWEGVRSGQGFAMETRLFRMQDGTYRWHLNRAVVLRDTNGKILRFVGTSTDIEDVKRSQESLRTAEERTRLIIDTALEAVITMDAQGTITSWNKQAEVIFGWDSNDAVGQRMSHLIIPEQQQAAHECGLRHFLATGDGPILRRRVEFTAVRRGGMEFPVELQVTPMRLGQEWAFSAFIRDITDAKVAEETLRKSELKFRQIVDSIPGLVCTMSPAGEIEQLNQQLLEYFGKTPAELKSWKMIDAVHPDDRRRVLTAFTHSIATGTPYEIEHRCRRADGVYRWFQVRALAMRDANGMVTGWYMLLTDIEDRKRAEDELRRSEAFLAQGQRLNLTGTFSWCLDTNEITFSEQLYHIFELVPDAPVTLEKIRGRVHPEDIPLLVEKIDLARRGIKDLDYEIRLRMPDGSIKYLRTNAFGMRDRDGRLEYMGAIQDVTERRLAEEALGKLRLELAHMARVTSLGALTASIAHEVNQPLSGIVTNANTCVRMLSANPPNIDGALETARRTIRDGNRASEVIARLRALFSKKETANEDLDLNEAAREVISLTLSELQRNRVILRQELADDLPPVRGDRVQLQQVILNLLRNASDAMSNVEDRPRNLVIKTARDEDNCVRLAVQDAGVGVDSQSLGKLFDPFYSTKSAGMGMGLSVSRTIIESHHGRLWATPNEGPGAIFSFSVPLKPVSADTNGPGVVDTPIATDSVKAVRKS